jgi:hypothetical protein
VIVRVNEGRALADLRTVAPLEEETLLDALVRASRG